MKEQQGTTEARNRTVIMEVIMILPAIQFFALEEAAHWQNLSVARLLRRAIADFLQQPESVSGAITIDGRRWVSSIEVLTHAVLHA